MKIICLGNEFIEEDSLAKKVGHLLKEDHEIVNIKDSFQLMTILHQEDNPTILDVVKGIKEIKEIKSEDLKTNSILSAHDFDATQVIKLLDKPVRIIGIPMQGNVEEIFDGVKRLLKPMKMITEKEAITLLEKYLPKEKHGVITHSVGVADIAHKFAIKISKKHPKLNINPHKVKIAAILHDIGKIKGQKDHELHTIEILKKENLNELIPFVNHGLIYEQYLIGKNIEDKTKLPKTIESKIISYADWLFNLEPVSLKERLEDLKRRYKHRPEINKILNPGYLRLKKIEKEILALVGEKNYATKYLGKTITVEMDRPLGSKHPDPKYGYTYEVNYGFIPNTKAPDGGEVDVYVLGIDKPIKEFTGKAIAVIRRKEDDDDKVVIVPEGMQFTDKEIIKLTKFQEKNFTIEIVRK